MPLEKIKDLRGGGRHESGPTPQYRDGDPARNLRECVQRVLVRDIPLLQSRHFVAQCFQPIALRNPVNGPDNVAFAEFLPVNGVEKGSIPIGDDETRRCHVPVEVTSKGVEEGEAGDIVS